MTPTERQLRDALAKADNYISTENSEKWWEALENLSHAVTCYLEEKDKCPVHTAEHSLTTTDKLYLGRALNVLATQAHEKDEGAEMVRSSLMEYMIAKDLVML